MTTILVSFGANLGDPSSTFQSTLSFLGADPDFSVTAVSREHWTAPIGGPPGQHSYLNAVIRLDTSHTMGSTLRVLQSIEARLGRQPAARWDPRVADLDLLLYGDESMDSADLVVPHPRLCFRRFVLAPAVEVASEWKHPLLGVSLASLLRHLDTAHDYIALTGPAGIGKSDIVQQVCERCQCSPLRDPALTHDAPLTGPRAATDIEFLRRRAALLRQAMASRGAPSEEPSALTTAQYMLSDFWLDQSLLYAHWAASTDHYAQVHKVWKELSPTTPRPKLLVVLVPKRVDVDGRAMGFYESAIEHVASVCPLPVLKLNAGDPQWAQTEILAAMDAMKPHEGRAAQ